MAKLLVLYNAPKDSAAFDAHYRDIHIPIAKKIPGLRRFEVSRSPVMTPQGPSPVYLLATLHFDSAAAIQAAFNTPEGQAAAADLANFASGGVDMYICDDHDV